jgi:ubiquinone biosynthesis accessory factor UbiK
MLDPKRFEELAARLGSVIAASPVGDLQKNAQALLSSFFSKLDLVSREEFDIQTQVLLRTREKLKTLEARLDELEKRAVKNSDNPLATDAEQ